jgi:uncharacterized protein YggE
MVASKDNRLPVQGLVFLSTILSEGEHVVKKILAVAAVLLASVAARADVTVQGDGKVTVLPNKAHITLGVTTDGKTASEALEANSKAMKALFKKLAELGIADRDVQTVALNLTPKYKHPKDQEPELIGYVASHQIGVTVRKVDETGTVLDALVQDGANQVQGISFGVEENEKLMDEARVKAVADARRKADLYAAAAGVSVGKVVTISEVNVGWPQARVWSPMEFKADTSTPIAKGEQQLSVTVTVVFSIAEAKERQ